MTDTITIHPYNAVFDLIETEKSIDAELSDYFTFVVPGSHFHPLVRNKVWDGKIRLYSTAKHQLYAGLRSYVEKFAGERQYEVKYAEATADKEFSVVEAKAFIDTLNLPFEVRDYQLRAFVSCIRSGRRLVVSPTASGKSLIIYLLYQYYSGVLVKTLLVVPTVNLVLQMHSDFVSYGMHPDDAHKIFSGEDKETDKRLSISTWQSLMKQPKAFFNDFDLVVIDEAHGAQAKSLKDIMEKLTSCHHRFGFTGTLDGTQTHLLVLTGLFGKVLKVATTSELIDQQHLSPFEIKTILLHHPEIACKLLKKATYQDEVDFLVSNGDRNRFIKNLALSLEGNTLVLFRLVEKHGKGLYDEIKTAKDRKVFYLHGGVEASEREEVRRIIESEKNAIIVGSYGVLSTGINILALHNIIFASPYKSRIKVLQSIGRGLRKADNKDICTLYDIADDLSYKKHQNHTLKHFIERIKIYNAEKFDYKLYRITLKGAK